MTEIERFEDKVVIVTESGCWIWVACSDKDGYGKFQHEGKSIQAHRASYLIYKGEIPKGMLVCHSCDITSCVNPEHLFLGSHKDNIVDSVLKGRHSSLTQSGEKGPNAKLTEEQADEIRQSKESYSVLAKKYGVGRTTIWHVKKGNTWN